MKSKMKSVKQGSVSQLYGLPAKTSKKDEATGLGGSEPSRLQRLADW